VTYKTFGPNVDHRYIYEIAFFKKHQLDICDSYKGRGTLATVTIQAIDSSASAKGDSIAIRSSAIRLRIIGDGDSAANGAGAAY